MKIEECVTTPHYVMIDCLVCGQMYGVEDFRGSDMEGIFRETYEKYRVCPACVAAQKKARAEEAELLRRAELLNNLPEALAEAGFPKHYRFLPQDPPPRRYAAEFVWKHRRENLLMSGATGCGKSTSACFVAARMIADGLDAVYYELRDLLSEWRVAKTTEKRRADAVMIRKICDHDLVIIDEFVGKVKITDSAQELLFDLLEKVNSGECRAKMWILGNFFSGSMEVMFSDSQPVRRRLQENFRCVLLDEKRQSIEPLTVWKQ